MRSTMIGAILAAALAAPALAQAPAQPAFGGAQQPTGAGGGQTQALSFAGGRIFQATGFSNTFMVTTRAGNVVIDTSSPFNVARHRALLLAQSQAPVRDVILT